MNGRFFHLSLVNVNHDDLGGSCPCAVVIADLTYADSCANREKKIGILNGKVSRAVAHVAASAAIERVIILYNVNAVPVCYDGNAEKL